MKSHAALILACIAKLFNGRAATSHPTSASSVVLFADAVVGTKLRSFQERAFCWISEYISIGCILFIWRTLIVFLLGEG